MRLKKIKLAGFKSFVDPTTVDFNSDRVAIVGPNGCGKSNVIDAVRWVMGESSAKQLRSESMADVIFSGSVGRAPVGQASVELIFDNSEGSLGGEYAAFNEIAIKRLVTQDGQSNYYLNNARCRRKDITDIFLGTGLGPRSYAIIEQGMISRLIDAKPEDLRIFLEEAAGISKYKERRRETENRIGHTQENLERLSDLRSEIAKQLARLEKQAESAEKYKELKKILRQVSAEHHALKWRAMDIEMTAKHRELAEQEIQVEKEVSCLRQIDAQIEQQRVAYDAAQEDLQKAQGEYYRSAAQVAKHEQSLEHQRERQNQIEMDLAQLTESFDELQEVLNADEQQWSTMNDELIALTPQAHQLEHEYKNSHQALTMAEDAMNLWQKNWESVNQYMSEANQQAFVAKEKMIHLQDNIAAAMTRLETLRENHLVLVNTDLTHTLQALQGECQNSSQKLTQAKDVVTSLQQQLQSQQNSNDKIQLDLDVAREELQALQSEFVSLQALQHAAFDQQQDLAKNWLAQNKLNEKQRLVQQLAVEPEWICAVETVLGYYLQAICVDKLETFAEKLSAFNHGSVVLFENTQSQANNSQFHERALINKIKTPLLIANLLKGVYYAETLAEALQMRSQLAPHESVVTMQGIWMSAQWLRITRSLDQQAGILAREQQLKVLQPRIAQLQTQLQTLQHDLAAGKEQFRSLTEQLTVGQREVNQCAQVDTDLQAQYRALNVRQEEIVNQTEKVAKEIVEIEQRVAQQTTQLSDAKVIHEEAQISLEKFSADKGQLESVREQMTEQLQQAKEVEQRDQSNNNRVHVELSGLTHRLAATQNQLQRTQQQLEKLRTRKAQLQQAQTASFEPIEMMNAELESAIDKQVEDETLMQTARAHVDLTAHQLRQAEQERLQSEERVNVLRGAVEEYRLAEQSIRIKRDAIIEQLQAVQAELSDLLQQLPDQAE